MIENHPESTREYESVDRGLSVAHTVRPMLREEGTRTPYKNI